MRAVIVRFFIGCGHFVLTEGFDARHELWEYWVYQWRSGPYAESAPQPYGERTRIDSPKRKARIGLSPLELIELSAATKQWTRQGTYHRFDVTPLLTAKLFDKRYRLVTKAALRDPTASQSISNLVSDINSSHDLGT
jgi:hypothetical protein